MAAKVDLEITIGGETEADPGELEQAARSLRRELAEADLGVVTFQSAAAPPGAKGEGLTWGSLILTLAAGQGLPTAIGKLLDWVSRRPDRTLTLGLGGDTLQVGGLSPTEQQRLIKTWLARHPTPHPKEPAAHG